MDNIGRERPYQLRDPSSRRECELNLRVKRDRETGEQPRLDDGNGVSAFTQMRNTCFPGADDAIDLGTPGIGCEQDA